MSKDEVLTIIVNIFNEKPVLKNINKDEDFFDRGASSLTIVDIQLQIEKALKKTVETPKLMANPTINGWVEAYTAS